MSLYEIYSLLEEIAYEYRNAVTHIPDHPGGNMFTVVPVDIFFDLCAESDEFISRNIHM